MVWDTPRVENSIFYRVPSPSQGCLLDETSPHRLRGRAKRWPGGRRGKVTAWPSRLRTERARAAQALHHPYSCLPGSAAISSPSKAGQAKAAWIGTREGRAATHSLAFEHSVTWTHAWAVRPIRSFLINTVLIESLLCSKPCQASLL